MFRIINVYLIIERSLIATPTSLNNIINAFYEYNFYSFDFSAIPNRPYWNNGNYTVLSFTV